MFRLRVRLYDDEKSRTYVCTHQSSLYCTSSLHTSKLIKAVYNKCLLKRFVVIMAATARFSCKSYEMAYDNDECKHQGKYQMPYHAQNKVIYRMSILAKKA